MRDWSLIGHSLLAVAHVANAIGALATLWGRPVFAMAAIVLATVQTAVALQVASQTGSDPPD